MILYFGNELFLGIVLGIWLFSTSMGSFLGVRFLKMVRRKLYLFWVLLTAFWLLPAEVILLRWLTAKFFPIYKVPSPFWGIVLIILILFPFCFLLGGLFALGTRFFSKEKGNFGVWAGKAYLWETLGLAIGGLLFNFILIKTSFPLFSVLNSQTLKFKFPNLVETRNTKYGKIAVVDNHGQYSFYESGLFLGSTGEREQSEYFAHLALSFFRKPKRILMVGGGFGGIISEILKYKSVEKIDYVELDPEVFDVLRKYLPEDLGKSFNDKRVTLHFVDGIRYLGQTEEKYDLIIFNLPNPSTALLNRFYTLEAFGQVKRRLGEGGVFVFSLFAPVDYLSEESRMFLSIIYETLGWEFGQVKILPEETEIMFVAGQDLPIKGDLIKNFMEEKVESKFVSPEYLEYRISSPKIKIEENFEKTGKINTNFQPFGYFYQNAFWQTMFNFKLAKIFGKIGEVNFVVILIFFGAMGLFFLNLKEQRKIMIFLVGISGVTLMTFEILIIFIFQAVLGILFSKIALLLTVILISMAVGNWVAGNFLFEPRKILMAIEFLVILTCIWGIFFLKSFNFEIQFLFLAGVVGFLGGTVFPLSSKIYFEKKRNYFEKWTNGVGWLYGADLFGAMLAAVLVSVFLIPIFGVVKTIVLVAVLNLGGLFLLQKLGRCK